MVMGLIGKFRQTVSRLDEDSPGKIRRRSVQFLIDEISPTANCLTQGNRWRKHIQPGTEMLSLGPGKRYRMPANRRSPPRESPTRPPGC